MLLRHAKSIVSKVVSRAKKTIENELQAKALSAALDASTTACGKVGSISEQSSKAQAARGLQVSSGRPVVKEPCPRGGKESCPSKDLQSSPDLMPPIRRDSGRVAPGMPEYIQKSLDCTSFTPMWETQTEQKPGNTTSTFPSTGLQSARQPVEGGDSAPLLCSCEAPPGVLRPVLGPPAREGHDAVGGGPQRRSEGWSTLSLLCEDRVRLSVLFSLEKRRLQGDLTATFQYPKGPTEKLGRDFL